MSRSWSDTVTASVSVDRVVLLRVRGWLLRQVVDKEILPLPMSNTVDDWSAMVDLLQSTLAQERWRTPRLRVVLSNQLVRYACVPWSDAVKGAVEEQALVRHRLDAVYGSAAMDACELRWDSSGARRLCAALSRSGLTQLRDVCQALGVRLTHVQPLWMVVVNAYLDRLRPDALAWLAVVEDGFLSLASMDEQGWRSLSCTALTQPLQDLGQAVSRERLQHGYAPALQETLWVWDGHAGEVDRVDGPLQIRRWVGQGLPGVSATAEPDYAAAVLGALA